MGRLSKWIWNAVVGAVNCWSIVGFGDAWLSGDAVVFGSHLVSSALAMQTYAALAFGAAIFLVMMNWSWVDTKRPSRRFRRLEEELATTRRIALVRDDDSARNSARIRAIVRELDKLKIEHPDLDAPPRIWRTYLMRLSGEARAGALREARTVWRDMQADPP